MRSENWQSQVVNTQTTNYTLTAEDNGALIVINSGTGKTVTIDATLPVGFWCDVLQAGAGQVTFATSSTTLHNRQSHTKTNAQYAKVTLSHYSNNPNAANDIFVLSGDTGA